MKFLPMKKLVSIALEKGFAVPAFAAWNAEIVQTILGTAEEMNAPIILMSGPGEFPVLSPHFLGKIGYSIYDDYNLPAALHLDHGNTLDIVKECINARYTSLMLDYSAKPFEDNICGMQEVVKLAKPLGISVEGEIGTIGRDFDITVEGSKHSVFTDVEEAKEFAQKTGIDIVAVSIGNVHGNYKGEPHLNFSLLKDIRDAVEIPIALHGGSGLSENDIKKGISLGISKVNIATELMTTYKNTLISIWKENSNIWLPFAIRAAADSLRDVVRKWIKITGAEKKAHLIT